jgi:hypothetical protein
MFNNFVGYENIVPLLAPQDITTTVTPSGYMNLKGTHKAAFLVILGNIASTSADTMVITCTGATTDNGGTEAAIGFSYRISGALGANTWGAITSVTTTGLSLTLTSDNMLVWIELDPSDLAAGDYNYVKLLFTDTTDMDNCLVAVLGIVQPRYKMSTMQSVTASASA